MKQFARLVGSAAGFEGGGGGDGPRAHGPDDVAADVVVVTATPVPSNARSTGAPDGTVATRMAAMRFVAPGRVELVDVPKPVPAAGEVLIRIEGSGVGIADLPAWGGRPWFDYPLDAGSPGCEGWGVVIAHGKNADGGNLPSSPPPPVGTRVAFLSSRAYAEYAVVPFGRVVPIPTRLADGPVPSTALAWAESVVHRSGIAADSNVAVVGTDFLAALLVQRAVAAGASVLACSDRRCSRELAAALGARVATLGGSPASGGKRCATPACDVVIEAAGTQAALDAAAVLTRDRGRLVIAGVHEDGPRRMDMGIWNRRGLDVIHVHDRDRVVQARSLRAAISALEAGHFDLGPLITHVEPLDRLADLMPLLIERPEGFVKAIVRCRAPEADEPLAGSTA